jgi:hypothetical protein
VSVEERSNGEIELRVLWRGVEDSPILYANQFVLQTDQDEVILTLGQLVQPILIGDQEERLAQARELSHVSVKIIGRFSMTRERAGDFLNALRDHLAKYDAAHEA